MLQNVLIVKLAKLYTVNLYVSLSALYMLRNVLIVKLAKLYTVNLYVSFSALYTLQYVPIVIILVIVYLFKKKKKQNKTKMTRTSVWVKIPKLCHNTPLSIFSLGKGRESLRLKTLHKKLFTSVLSDLPPAQNDLAKRRQCTSKLPKICIFFHEFHTFPVTQGNEI